MSKTRLEARGAIIRIEKNDIIPVLEELGVYLLLELPTDGLLEANEP